ncbi:MAG: hypothetical protein BJ554DRAFT_8206 [Olpidium bornovanus]|uniref:Uncharacterized protein n=1 Tax=Olpidium bornovanus TaxID=278681 RepID=A0A8H8A1S2_9FUNG|nr:MAG: hypothetical protein BJ554DRAFT_8206 [Olpidium bornovanus]
MSAWAVGREAVRRAGWLAGYGGGATAEGRRSPCRTRGQRRSVLPSSTSCASRACGPCRRRHFCPRAVPALVHPSPLLPRGRLAARPPPEIARSLCVAAVPGLRSLSPGDFAQCGAASRPPVKPSCTKTLRGETPRSASDTRDAVTARGVPGGSGDVSRNPPIPAGGSRLRSRHGRLRQAAPPRAVGAKTCGFSVAVGRGRGPTKIGNSKSQPAGATHRLWTPFFSRTSRRPSFPITSCAASEKTPTRAPSPPRGHGLLHEPGREGRDESKLRDREGTEAGPSRAEARSEAAAPR